MGFQRNESWSPVTLETLLLRYIGDQCNRISKDETVVARFDRAAQRNVLTKLGQHCQKVVICVTDIVYRIPKDIKGSQSVSHKRYFTCKRSGQKVVALSSASTSDRKVRGDAFFFRYVRVRYKNLPLLDLPKQ